MKKRLGNKLMILVLLMSILINTIILTVDKFVDSTSVILMLVAFCVVAFLVAIYKTIKS